MYKRDETVMTPLEKAWNTLYYNIALEDLEYADNLRVADIDDQAETQRYYDAVDQGCCGSFDIRITIENVTFMVGCNYGH